MAVGDFNGDGKLNVALAGYVSSTQEVVQIELGKGDGTFTTSQTIDMAPNLNATGITTGDFDGDGKLDLAVISNTANQVYFYKGSGTGTFTSAASVTVGSSPWTLTGIRVGDFNADGKIDLVVSNYKGLFVLWNNGGNFSFTLVKVGSSNYGIGATPVDINQDGFTDLLVVYYTCEVGKWRLRKIVHAGIRTAALRFNDFAQLVDHVIKGFCHGKLRSRCFDLIPFIDGL